ncbi:MAG: hypothetical protein PUD02_07890, partial [Eggerthellales bacterium]|nr:hypothetical protein [Eggerthellales bacterium]
MDKIDDWDYKSGPRMDVFDDWEIKKDENDDWETENVAQSFKTSTRPPKDSQSFKTSTGRDA